MLRCGEPSTDLPAGSPLCVFTTTEDGNHVPVLPVSAAYAGLITDARKVFELVDCPQDVTHLLERHAAASTR